MELVGEYRIAAPRLRVWEALNDPQVLMQCIPGCKALERTAADSLRAIAVAQLGPVRANLQGTVDLSDLNPPAGYTLSWQGSGGAAGFARGSAEVTLDEAGSGETLLRYKALCTVGGKLAQIGSRLIDGTARKLADEFFEKFAGLVGGERPQAEGEVHEPEVGAHKLAAKVHEPAAQLHGPTAAGRQPLAEVREPAERIAASAAPLASASNARTARDHRTVVLLLAAVAVIAIGYALLRGI